MPQITKRLLADDMCWFVQNYCHPQPGNCLLCCPQVAAGASPLTLGLQVIVGAGGPGPFEHPSFSVIRIGDLEHARTVAEAIVGEDGWNPVNLLFW